MTDIWRVAVCDTEELGGYLEQGWEPYAVIWVAESKYREKKQHWLKTRRPADSMES